MELALNEVTLRLDSNAEAVSQEQLVEISSQFLTMRQELERLTKRYHPVVLDIVRFMPPLSGDDCLSEDKVADWFNSLQRKLVEEKGDGATYSVEVFSTTGGRDFGGKVTIDTHGIESTNVFTPDFFVSREYIALTTLESTHTLSNATIKRGDKEKQVEFLGDAFVWLLKEAAQGLHIQRYKGLGEMNPDQLWETTMDPENRRMLQVTIEDAIGADQLFTTLMGDEVEPRRDFIESNAMSVENLDV